MDTNLSSAYGFDPAFRHGALVYCTFDLAETGMDRLVSLIPCYVWNNKTSGFAVKSEPNEVFRMSQRISDGLTMNHVEKRPIAVDWDPQSVYWRASKMQIVQMSLFIGYLTRALHSMGYPVVFIKPAEVRRAIRKELADNTSKEVLHDWFMDLCDIEKFKSALTTKNHDLMDSVILAYLVCKATRITGGNQWAFLTYPESSI